MKEESVKLVRDVQLKESMDFDFLKKKAIEYTQMFSGKKWTDYNAHDPGVTILEQFCFVLTDIAYRTNLNIETLLFHDGDINQIKTKHTLFAPEEIFPTGAITLDDYRILILDGFPNKVSNCWVEKITDHREGIQGLYKVYVLPKNDLPQTEYEQLKTDIASFVRSRRNLCEDFDSVEFLQPERIVISADIDLRVDANAEDVLAELLFQLEYYFNPKVRFYSYQELSDMGIPTEDIFNIPSFEHGFILKRDLRPKQQEYYVSKIANYILELKGVRDLRNLTISLGGVPLHGDIIKVPGDKYLTLGILFDQVNASASQDFKISFYKGGSLSGYTNEGAMYALELKEAKTYRTYEIRTELQKRSASRFTGKDLLSYESIQKTFPGIYGLGDYTPSSEDGVERIAQSNQLKAYLMIFDQIMVNHLAQLTNISSLLSIDDFKIENLRTYYTEGLGDNVPNANELVKKRLAPRREILAAIANEEKVKTSLSDVDTLQVEYLKSDLLEKELFVRESIVKEFDRLVGLTELGIKRSKTFKNRDIIKVLLGCKKLLEERENSGLQKDEGPMDEGLINGIQNAQALMFEEWMEDEQFAEFKSHHLDRLMLRYDSPVERKDRLLTHYLARFGEQFTTDFQLKFSTLLEGEVEAEVTKKLIALKCAFLKEISYLNRYRAKAYDFYGDGGPIGKNTIPFKRRIAYLLDIEHDEDSRLTSPELKQKLDARRLSSSDIRKESQGNGRLFYKPDAASNKISFIVNGNNYYKYLFKYGLHRKNYLVTKEKDSWVVYFSPNAKEPASRLCVVESKAEANTKIDTLIRFLKDLNAKYEGFHVMEHIILRPGDGVLCHYHLKGLYGAVLFNSREVKSQDEQSANAFDALLLGCYSSNYRVLQNIDKQFVVIIKNQVGKELAISKEIFPTEVAAKNFIEKCVKYYNEEKEADNLLALIGFDNDQKYHFQLLNENGVSFFQSTELGDVKNQEEAANDLLATGMYSAKYRIKTDLNDHFAVFLLNTRNVEAAKSKVLFDTRDGAETFIRKSISYFENLIAGKSIVQYTRLSGRSADDYNFQLSIVYPDWTARFSNLEFIQLFERAVFYGVPAHLRVNLVGLNYSEMILFEDNYFELTRLHKAAGDTDTRASLERVSSNILNLLLSKTDIIK